jgi:phospholipid transport system transporter-binding protein
MTAVAYPCDPPAGGDGGFVAGPDGDWAFVGALTFDNASEVLERSRELPLPKNGRVDLTGMATADSSALAVLLALRRRAHGERRKLHFEGQPASLEALGRVYGIEELMAG